MAVSAGTAVLQVAPQLVKSFSRDVVSQMAGPAQKAAVKTGQQSGRKFGVGFSGGIRTGVGPVRGIMRGFGPALAGAFGAAALVQGIKSVTDEAREAAIVGRQTAAVLKSTGGAANISAKGVEKLATALSNKSGVDDEVIQTSQNLLLTFTGIRNEVGRGNDVFNQASTSIVDMTAAMNGGKVTASGLKSATIQVGKALNDPIKGMTALSRVGVTFNDQQREQIKTLVESGDKLGAQKIILGELRKEFGGSAAASADAGKRFGVFVGNLKEQVGAVLLPVLNRLLGFLVDKLPGALARVGGFFRLVSTGVKALVSAFKEGDVTSDGFVGVMESIGVTVRAVWGTIARLLVPALRSIADSLKPAIAAFVKGLLPGLKSLWRVIQAQVLPALKLVATVIGVALYAALKFILPLLLRIAGPVLGFFIKQLGQTIQWISNVIRWIGRVGAWLLRWITGTKSTGAALIKLGLNALKVFRAIFNAVSSAVIGILRVMGKLPGPMGKPFRAAAEAATRAKNTITAQMDKIQGRINRLKGKKVEVTARARISLFEKTRQALAALGIKGYGTKFLATGGPVTGPGTGTSDSIPAIGPGGTPYRLSNDEHVWTAKEVRNAGGHRGVEAIRAQFRADGGPVGQFGGMAARAVGKLGTAGAERLASFLGRALGKAVEKGMGAGSAAIKAFIRSTDRLPYIWGAAGPGGYDCSGLVGAVYGKMRGHKGAGRGTRFFTTATIGGQAGLKPGLGGTLQVGVTAGTGHMAGRYGGLGFEAESSRTGIKIGGAASRPESFARKYHMAAGGRIDERRVAALIAQRAGADIGGDQGKLRVNGQTFDRGGTLAPGLNLLANRTGRPEPLVPAGQGIDYDRLARAVALALSGQPVRAYMDPNQARQGIKDAQRRGGVPSRDLLR